MSKAALDAIRTQVMWNRLIAVVEEQAQSLLRTAFGTITRASAWNCHSGSLGGWFDEKPQDPANSWRWMAGCLGTGRIRVGCGEPNMAAHAGCSHA